MLRFLTAGESHGAGLVAILERMVKGLPLTEAYLAAQLARRQNGYGRGQRQAIEKDQAKIVAGVRFGKSLGSPIALLIENRDAGHWQEKMSLHEKDRKKVKAVTAPRPGHADLAGLLKYEDHDIRNVLERASARETAARVAIGAVCRKLLAECGVQIFSWVLSIGHAKFQTKELFEGTAKEVAQLAQSLFEQAESSPVRCPDKEGEKAMISSIKAAQIKGDTLGGCFQVVATGLPPGLGSFMHADKKIDGQIAQAVMSIPAVKGVEIGLGFQSSEKFGTETHDPIFYGKREGFYRTQNYAGGLEGGVTNGMPLILQGAMKPIATTMKGLPSVDVVTKKPTISLKERSDVCAVPACAVVAEAVVAFVLADSLLEKFGGDTLSQLQRALQSYRQAISSDG